MQEDGQEAGHSRSKLFALTLGALGVVYGDIGTSPLYAFHDALAQATRTGAT
jgi:KUP system potassium uptake protein